MISFQESNIDFSAEQVTEVQFRDSKKFFTGSKIFLVLNSQELEVEDFIVAPNSELVVSTDKNLMKVSFGNTEINAKLHSTGLKKIDLKNEDTILFQSEKTIRFETITIKAQNGPYSPYISMLFDNSTGIALNRYENSVVKVHNKFEYDDLRSTHLVFKTSDLDTIKLSSVVSNDIKFTYVESLNIRQIKDEVAFEIWGKVSELTINDRTYLPTFNEHNIYNSPWNAFFIFIGSLISYGVVSYFIKKMKG